MSALCTLNLSNDGNKVEVPLSSAFILLSTLRWKTDKLDLTTLLGCVCDLNTSPIPLEAMWPDLHIFFCSGSRGL